MSEPPSHVARLKLVAPAPAPPGVRARLLVVTAGEAPAFLEPLRERMTGLVTVHRLGEEAEPGLDEVRLVLFALDGAAEGPAAAQARRIALRADTCWIPVLNRPNGPGAAAAPAAWAGHERRRAYVLMGEVMNAGRLDLEPGPSGGRRGLAQRLAAAFGARQRDRAGAAADLAFAEAPPQAVAQLAAACRAAGADVATVDYALQPDGAVRVIKVRAGVELAAEAGRLARRRRLAERNRRVLDRLAETLEAALAREAGTGLGRRSAA
ncbi:MAG: hypothetical protein ACK4YQ_19495 [Phenylobacterium sp.]|uniref:hypothetical protein n=1 Tax=Phenylobacterium sp. TaxID=1871053 RepID=UPI00391DFF62